MEKIAKNAGMGADAPADAAIPDLPSRPASFRGGESAVTAAARERAANVARVN